MNRDLLMSAPAHIRAEHKRLRGIHGALEFALTEACDELAKVTGEDPQALFQRFLSRAAARTHRVAPGAQMRR